MVFGTDDTTLLRRAAAGAEGAMAELYASYAAVCRRRAYLVLRDAALADDATQEAFVDLWRRADRFDPRRAPLAAWLCVLAHRRAVDIARREARRRELTDELQDVDAASYTTEELVLSRLERREVQNAIETLPHPQREVVELAYFGGLSQSQLATRLGIPLGTVKSRTHAALALLAQLVAPPAAAA